MKFFVTLHLGVFIHHMTKRFLLLVNTMQQNAFQIGVEAQIDNLSSFNAVERRGESFCQETNSLLGMLVNKDGDFLIATLRK